MQLSLSCDFDEGFSLNFAQLAKPCEILFGITAIPLLAGEINSMLVLVICLVGLVLFTTITH